MSLKAKISKIKSLYFREVKYLLRDNSIRMIFISPFFLILLFLLSSKNKNLPLGLNIFHFLLIILIIDNEIYTNQFANIKSEFKIYCILPVSKLNLLISKNLFTLVIISGQFLITIILFLIFGEFKIKVLFNSLVYFFLTVPLLIGLGNVISIYFPRGFIEERKEQPFFSSIFLPLFSVIFSSIPYFLFSFFSDKSSNLLIKTVIFLLLTIIDLAIYYYLLRFSINLLHSRKFNILAKI